MVCHEVFRVWSQTVFYCSLLWDFENLFMRKMIMLCNNWAKAVAAAWEDQRSAARPDGWGDSALGMLMLNQKGNMMSLASMCF